MSEQTQDTAENVSVPRCMAKDIGITAADSSPEAAAIVAKIDKYLSSFAAPNPRRPLAVGMVFGSATCPNCDSQLDGMMGCFQWGMVHGEGNCTHEGCGWPCRAKHEIPDVFARPVEMVLAYHPSVVDRRRIVAEEMR